MSESTYTGQNYNLLSGPQIATKLGRGVSEVCMRVEPREKSVTVCIDSITGQEQTDLDAFMKSIENPYSISPDGTMWSWRVDNAGTKSVVEVL